MNAKVFLQLKSRQTVFSRQTSRLARLDTVFLCRTYTHSITRAKHPISSLTPLQSDNMADDVPDGGHPLPYPGVGPGSVQRYPKQEEWKTRPPYRVVPRAEFGEVKWKGGCHCGRVTYELNREQPLKAKYCHCRGCQIVHGAPFQWAAIFQKTDISFTSGTDGLAFYASDRKTTKYELPTKVSCAYCRTPIMDEGRNMCLLFPGTIHFGSSEEEQEAWKKAFAISCHIFYSQRSLDIPDGKQKWSGMDDNSDLVDDYGRKT